MEEFHNEDTLFRALHVIADEVGDEKADRIINALLNNHFVIREVKEVPVVA